jgi:hypothetical protein
LLDAIDAIDKLVFHDVCKERGFNLCEPVRVYRALVLFVNVYFCPRSSKSVRGPRRGLHNPVSFMLFPASRLRQLAVLRAPPLVVSGFLPPRLCGGVDG